MLWAVDEIERLQRVIASPKAHDQRMTLIQMRPVYPVSSALTAVLRLACTVPDF